MDEREPRPHHSLGGKERETKMTLAAEDKVVEPSERPACVCVKEDVARRSTAGGGQGALSPPRLEGPPRRLA